MSLSYDCLENADKEGNLSYWTGEMTKRRAKDPASFQNVCTEAVNRLKHC